MLAYIRSVLRGETYKPGGSRADPKAEEERLALRRRPRGARPADPDRPPAWARRKGKP